MGCSSEIFHKFRLLPAIYYCVHFTTSLLNAHMGMHAHTPI